MNTWKPYIFNTWSVVFNTRLVVELSPPFLSKQRWCHILSTSPDHLQTTQKITYLLVLMQLHLNPSFKCSQYDIFVTQCASNLIWYIRGQWIQYGIYLSRIYRIRSLTHCVSNNITEIQPAAVFILANLKHVRKKIIFIQNVMTCQNISFEITER